MDVVMPQLGETVKEGTVSAWHKKVGERVEKDEPLFEVETEKVDTEVPAPAAGVLAEILVRAGETVSVGTRLAVIQLPGEARPAPGAASPARAAAQPTAPAASAPVARAAAPPRAAPRPPRGEDDRKLSPVVRRLLAEHRLDPADVDHLVPHQANGKMIETLQEDLGLPRASTHATVRCYGNTGAASVAITLDAAARAQRFQPGEIVLLAAFGGGMSAGLALLRW